MKQIPCLTMATPLYHILTVDMAKSISSLSSLLINKSVSCFPFYSHINDWLFLLLASPELMITRLILQTPPASPDATILDAFPEGEGSREICL